MIWDSSGWYKQDDAIIAHVQHGITAANAIHELWSQEIGKTKAGAPSSESISDVVGGVGANRVLSSQIIDRVLSSQIIDGIA